MDALKSINRVRKATQKAKSARKGCGICSCFVPGTAVTMSSGDQVPIEDVDLGDRVHSREANACKNLPEDDWKRIYLKVISADDPDRWVDVELLRQASWFETNVAKDGGPFWLELEHLEFSGWAQFVGEEDYGDLPPGPGCPVTGTFRQIKQELVELEFAESTERLVATRAHPLFSATRQDWVAAAAVVSGELLETSDGLVRVVGVRAHRDRTENVFNLESCGHPRILCWRPRCPCAQHE